MGMIITISGVSGSGKTSLFEHLLSSGHKYNIVQSVTTRPPRERDYPGEFLHLSLDEFASREQRGEFLWVTPLIHGIRYGTLRESVDVALVREEKSIMVITVDCIKNLIEYVGGNNRNVLGLYVLSPGVETIRKRLQIRGEDEPAIEKRIHDCRGWYIRALELGAAYPIVYLSNNKGISQFFSDADERIKYYFGTH